MTDRSQSLPDLLARHRFVPVVTLNRVADAVPLARALASGGIGIIEVTLRTPSAWDCARAIRAELPEMVVGVGTAMRLADLQRAAELRLAFAVSPGLSEELARAAKDVPVAYLPGVQTVSEAMRARELGFTTLKFFPCESAGGVGWLKMIYPVLPELRFCPTGGLTEANAGGYLAQPNVAAVGGAWLAPASLIERGDWTAVERTVRTSRENLRR